MQGLYDQGGCDAVNAALQDADPASTEQILHPEKYLANEAPVAIDAAGPVRPTWASGWSQAYQQTMGEL